ncbi:MAG: hypothetical protein PHW98_02355 [Candidatus Omnitrophica bacterium]|nr:hypothetical protein [Candidatus Omnitrophota bacterium]
MSTKILIAKPSFKQKHYPFLNRIIAALLSFLLLFEQSAVAQTAGEMDISGRIGNFMMSAQPGSFRPAHLRYISYDKLKQSFRVILNMGDSGGYAGASRSILQPLRFFYIGLTIPNEDLWVNLRPDSADDVINGCLSATDLGKILLEADLELKKDLAHATFPSTPEGKEYWDKIYGKIEEIYGPGIRNTRTCIDTRIWVVPGETIICEDENSAYIYKARLDVVTETEYLRDKRTGKNIDRRIKIINDYSSRLMKDIILPKIRKEINTGSKYAPLRQAYYSLILAQWFKHKFYGAGGLYPYLINRRNLTGLTSKEKWSKDTYFKEYQKSYLGREYDLEVSVFDLSGKSVRTYSSGGIDFTGILNAVNPAQINVVSAGSFSPPSTEQGISFCIQGHTLQDPYSQEGITIAAKNTHPTLSPSDRPGINEAQVEKTFERLGSSSAKYIKKVLNSGRTDIKGRIRFIADELGFDISNGKGMSLLARKPATLRKNREFLEEAGLAVNITNLKSSRRSFVSRELKQVISRPRWQRLTSGEKLSVVAYLFDIYKLRASWVTKDKNWDYILKRFGLQNTHINYSSRSIEFIRQYELERSRKLKNAPSAGTKILKINEIIETMGLKAGGILDSAKESIPAPHTGKASVSPSQKERQEEKDRASENRLKTLRSDNNPQAPPVGQRDPGHPGDVSLLDRKAVPAYPSVSNHPPVLPANNTGKPGQDPVFTKLKSLESIMDADISPDQILMVLNTLINYGYDTDQYKAARQIARHIKPTNFLELRRIAATTSPFSSDMRLKHILELIASERPTELNVGLSRSFARINDWEAMLERGYLTETDIAELVEYCRKVYDVLPLHLTQETSDTIGPIYKRARSVHYLIQKTINLLIEQDTENKTKYTENVERLLKWGHYFSDYLGALSCLSALNIAKGYIVDTEKSNYYNGNGKANHKIKYSLWHWISAVPYIAGNAIKELNNLITRVNTTGNDQTPAEYYKLLSPTRIGPATSWVTRKHISLVISLSMAAFNISINILNGFNLWAGINTVIGFLTIPIIHYGFAMIGNYRTRKDLKNLHRHISVLEEKWKAHIISANQAQIRGSHHVPGEREKPVNSLSPVEQEISEINRLIKAGVIPSEERIKECLMKTKDSGQKDYLNRLNDCLAAIFMLEEEYSRSADTAFVDTLRSIVSAREEKK